MRVNFLQAAFATACVLTTTAACAELPAVLTIGRESIKEGHAAAHEKMETEWARAMRKVKLPDHYLGLTTMTGVREAWFLSPFPTFAAMEEHDQFLEKNTAPGTMDALDTRDGEHRSGSRQMITVLRKDLTYHGDQLNVAKTRYWVVTAFRVKLGHDADFAEGAKRFVAAYEKTSFPSPMICYQAIGGVPDGFYLYFMPIETLKEMDSMEERDKAARQAIGLETYGQMMKGAGDVFVSIETTYLRVNPKMSYVSKETEDADPAFWRPKAEAKPKAAAEAVKPTP